MVGVGNYGSTVLEECFVLRDATPVAFVHLHEPEEISSDVCLSLESLSNLSTAAQKLSPADIINFRDLSCMVGKQVKSSTTRS